MPASVPEIVKTVTLTGQNANIGSTNFFSPSSDGLFRITVYTELFNQGAGDGVGLDLAWTTLDNTALTGQAGFGAAPQTGFDSSKGTLIAGIKSGTNVKYSTSTSLSVGATYNFYIIVESLQ